MEDEQNKEHKQTIWMLDPPTDRPVRVYADGIYDLFHFGHARSLEQAKKSFPNTYLLVGCCNDEVTHSLKGKTVMTDTERYESLRHCKWVDEVIPDAPWVLNQEFMDKHQIDFVAHDSLPWAEPDFVKLDAYTVHSSVYADASGAGKDVYEFVSLDILQYRKWHEALLFLKILHGKAYIFLQKPAVTYPRTSVPEAKEEDLNKWNWLRGFLTSALNFSAPASVGVKAIGRFKETRRTEGISTSDIIMRIVKDYNDYVMRNLDRGYSRKDLGVSYVKEKRLRVNMSLRKLHEKVKKQQEKVEEKVCLLVSLLALESFLDWSVMIGNIHIVAKTAGMNHNLWVENADRLVAGFLEMFEEGCHKMVRS
ncbi:hypothetical protein Ccrd_013183 [Cynara cardunculus var. scolymus]|uniref:choline-phosphate cytidylyltransferase n=1 Tax=Cynara cardunculus var. scolymus TaxID=59895 RepID=A0A103YG24_CYNCS|nr:hypothetical protein Ccrd_013183 [Cynara cardunculus var. scolymus]